ncbi:hypothetical protein SAMN05444172_2417 [Burkholderia sp. GAS332]|nr:hypothetical protein SAMN05444172_2417 [Burkholderia sp. GAS332]
MFDNDEAVQQDILDDLKSGKRNGAYIVASSPAIPGRNMPGDNPPHVKSPRSPLMASTWRRLSSA